MIDAAKADELAQLMGRAGHLVCEKKVDSLILISTVSSQELEQHVYKELARGMADKVQELARRITSPFNDERGMGKRYSMDVVVMRPDDFNRLTDLLREIINDG